MEDALRHCGALPHKTVEFQRRKLKWRTRETSVSKPWPALKQAAQGRTASCRVRWRTATQPASQPGGLMPAA